MITLRNRLTAQSRSAGSGLSGREVDFWRAAVNSCSAEPGDDADLDLDALRRQVRSEGVTLSPEAAHVEAIIREWEQTKDDKTFAMKTRFFPSGVKIPGVKWTL